MREENDLIEHDIRSQCFICSIQREEFGHNGMSYDHHVKHEHNMWKYVWFSIYIDEKDPNTMSGTEHYAYQMMQDKQSFVKLIPIKRSLSIERKQ
jgi:inositol 1,4,5-triphosphate receptor type 1